MTEPDNPPRVLIRLYSPAKPGREPTQRGPVAALYSSRDDRSEQSHEVDGVAVYTESRVYHILRDSARYVQRGMLLEDAETGERFQIDGLIDTDISSRTVAIQCGAETMGR